MLEHGTSVVLQVCSLIISLASAVAILAKPVRERLFGTKKIEEGQRCMLRAEMLSIYYESKDHEDKIRQYKALGGNSFIDKINKEVQQMEVVT